MKLHNVKLHIIFKKLSPIGHSRINSFLWLFYWHMQPIFLFFHRVVKIALFKLKGNIILMKTTNSCMEHHLQKELLKAKKSSKK